jgi:hypothetical protein
MQTEALIILREKLHGHDLALARTVIPIAAAGNGDHRRAKAARAKILLLLVNIAIKIAFRTLWASDREIVIEIHLIYFHDKNLTLCK